jgi:hypothetical protein
MISIDVMSTKQKSNSKRADIHRNKNKKNCTTYRCLTPSNLFDFFTANTSPSRPFLYRTFMTLPNSPLPTSSSSTKSRSNRPGRCSSAAFGSGGCSTRDTCGRLCVIPDTGWWRLARGELRVAAELDEEPETERSEVVVGLTGD